MNRSSRREEAPINFGFRISDFEKRASYSENGIRGNARPHPGPLPQERGEARTVPGIFTPLGVELLHGTHVGCYGSGSNARIFISGNSLTDAQIANRKSQIANRKS